VTSNFFLYQFVLLLFFMYSWLMHFFFGVSTFIIKENWSKNPDSDERIYKAGNFLQILFFHFLPQLYSDWSFLAKVLLKYVEKNPILQIRNRKFWLNVQTPMDESTMQEIFCENLIFFSFSSWELRWPPFSTKNISLICFTNFIL
jgi:hypothetical protein